MSILRTTHTGIKMDIMQLRAKAKKINPVLRVGKNGLTEGAVKEIEKQLKKRKLIKVKILKSALAAKNKDELIKDIVDKTSSVLIEASGFVVILAKK